MKKYFLILIGIFVCLVCVDGKKADAYSVELQKDGIYAETLPKPVVDNSVVLFKKYVNKARKYYKKYKKNKEAYALFLNLLVLGMRDMFHVKHSIPVLFVKHKDFFEKMPEDGKILQKIEIILEYAERLNNNVNLALLLDGMVYKVLKGV